MANRFENETGSSVHSRKGWRVWLSEQQRRADTFSNGFLAFLFLLVVGVAHALIWRPFEALLQMRETERFSHLAQLRFDALCRELVDGKDLELGHSRPAREHELRAIANHISEKCAQGAFDHYPQLMDVFSRKLFWVFLNGYAVG